MGKRGMRLAWIAVLYGLGTIAAQAQTDYRIFFGNTHFHCNYSGDILKKAQSNGEAVDPNNIPEKIFAEAKRCGYDFYAITDHSQYEVYTQQAFADIRQAAERSTDGRFVAMAGFEFSRNRNTDGKGHSMSTIRRTLSAPKSWECRICSSGWPVPKTGRGGLLQPSRRVGVQEFRVLRRGFARAVRADRIDQQRQCQVVLRPVSAGALQRLARATSRSVSRKPTTRS